MTRRVDRIVAILVVVMVAAAVRLLYIASYPFLAEGDGYEYYLLMPEARPHLLFAPGYPVLFGWLTWPTTTQGIPLLRVLPWLQQAVTMFALVPLVWSLTGLIGARLATAVGLLCAVDFVAVSSAGLSRPEFLQAAVLCVTLAALVHVRTAPKGPTLWHAALVGVLFGVGYLVKYNFITCLPLALVLWSPGMTLRRAALVVAALVTSAGLLVGGFLVGIHRPLTGSWSFNLEHGWVHMAKLGYAEIDIQPEAGLASQKYLVLNNALPEANTAGCCVRDLWYSVDAVPPGVRAEYRQQWHRLLETTDAGYVTSELSRLSEVSNRPSRFMRLYFYLGLAETEKLLQDVFFEAVRHDWRRYTRNVRLSVWAGTQLLTHYVSQVPVFEGGPFPPERVLEPCLCIRRDDPRFPGGQGSNYPMTAIQSCLQNLPPTPASIWKPGALLLGSLAWPALLLYRVAWFVALAHVVLIVGVFWRRRALSSSSVLALVVYASVFGLIVFSSVVWQFRFKELIFIQPLLWLAPALLLDDVRRHVSPRRDS